MESQAQQLLAYFKRGKSINPMTALRDLGIFRLGARVYDLRASGHRIDREWLAVTDWFGREKREAQYRLVQ